MIRIILMRSHFQFERRARRKVIKSTVRTFVDERSGLRWVNAIDLLLALGVRDARLELDKMRQAYGASLTDTLGELTWQSVEDDLPRQRRCAVNDRSISFEGALFVVIKKMDDPGRGDVASSMFDALIEAFPNCTRVN